MTRVPVRPIAEYVLKVASRCNLACDHCYVYGDPDRGWLRRPTVMDLATVRAAAIRIAEHAARHGLDRVAVILHGGEPLLVGGAALGRILAELRSVIDPVAELDLHLQSNGVRLTPAVCELLADQDVKVGISLDGDRLANDRHRRFADGTGSHDHVLRALELLRTPPYRAVYGGILCTIDIENDPIGVYEALLREEPPRIDFLLPHATWDHPPPRSEGLTTAYADWLLTIYDRWTADGRGVPIRILDSVLSLERGAGSGTEAVGPGAGAVAVIETDGSWEQVDSLKTVSEDAPRTGLDVRLHAVDECRGPCRCRRATGRRAVTDVPGLPCGGHLWRRAVRASVRPRERVRQPLGLLFRSVPSDHRGPEPAVAQPSVANPAAHGREESAAAEAGRAAVGSARRCPA